MGWIKEGFVIAFEDDEEGFFVKELGRHCVFCHKFIGEEPPGLLPADVNDTVNNPSGWTEWYVCLDENCVALAVLRGPIDPKAEIPEGELPRVIKEYIAGNPNDFSE